MRKGLYVFLCLCLTLLTFTPMTETVHAEEFNDDNVAEYMAMCSVDDLSESDKATCVKFQSWLSTQSSALQEAKKDLENQIASMRKNLNQYLSQISNLDSQIAEIEEEINQISAQIEELEIQIQIKEEEIAAKEREIEEKQGEIDVLNQKIQDRMVENQRTVHGNTFLNFIMGASDFSNLARIIKAIEDITNYDDKLISQLNKKIEELNADKALLAIAKDELDVQQAELEVQKTEVETKKASLIVKRAEAVAAKNLVEQQEADLEAQLSTIAAGLDELKANMKAIAESLNRIVPSKSFAYPTSNFRISAGTWRYSSGGIHLGADFAASVGTPVYAVANGIVFYTANACPTYGYLGNTCGSPGSAMGGNQVYLAISIDGVTYVIKYCHLQADSPIASGTIVNQGDVIARVGSSGNSSGPHLHLEIIKVGTMSISDYISNWNGQFDFGAGWSSANRPCSEYSAPCRLRPEDIYGF